MKTLLSFPFVAMLAVSPSLGGCGDPVAACQAHSPSISEGVYGCTTATNDVGERSVQANPGFAIQVFKTQPPATPNDGLQPLAQTKADADGFFEIALPSGTYWVCTAFRRCLQVTVSAGHPVREDYDFGIGPGWSSSRP